ncbi:class I SAM-dependent methyltransferase [Acidobacteria bacterium AH-259-A15]|nr:class I SAM-dependent methyltransferase [Acidobacteria bacterium AH-259-A15]
MLYRLENERLLNEGVGIEISNSRFKFAEKFKSNVNSHKVKNLNKNIFEISPESDFDLIIGVDIVLQLISPLNQSAERDILAWIRQSLRPKGFIILELWDFDHILKQIDITQNNLQIWEEFSENDPFEFVLAHISLNKENDIVWKKLFLKRDTMERSEFENVLRPYSPEKITSVLKTNGFESVEIFTKWSTEGDVSQDEYVVLAQKL